jgi:hypothetical protein
MTPEQMQQHDSEAWPGGRMAGFMLWVSGAKQRFYKEHPEAWIDRWLIRDHHAWVQWLTKWAELRLPPEPVCGSIWPFPAKLLDYPSHPPAARVPRPPLPDTPALF